VDLTTNNDKSDFSDISNATTSDSLRPHPTMCHLPEIYVSTKTYKNDCTSVRTLPYFTAGRVKHFGECLQRQEGTITQTTTEENYTRQPQASSQ